MEYFVQGVKIDGKGRWVEAAFYEEPSLPGVTFWMVPPTGVEPVSRA